MKHVFIFDTDKEAGENYNVALNTINKSIKNHVECSKRDNKKYCIKFKDGNEMYFMDFMEFANFKVGRSPDSYFICTDLNFHLTHRIDYYQSKDEEERASNINPGDEVFVKMRVVDVSENGITVQSNVIESFMVPVEDVVKQ